MEYKKRLNKLTKIYLKKIELMSFDSSSPITKKLTFAPEYEEPNDSNEEGEENIKTIINKSIGVTDKGFGVLPKKYSPFPDGMFGIWQMKKNFYIGDKGNKVLIDGNDLIMDNERYKGRHGLRSLLTNPNKKLDKNHMNRGGLTRLISRKKIIIFIKKFSRKHILSK